jgi:hypothetical protein
MPADCRKVSLKTQTYTGEKLEKACQLFAKLEIQVVDLEQSVIIIEQHLEGPLNDTVLQEFTEQEVVTLQQVEDTRAKLEAFEAELVRLE